MELVLIRHGRIAGYPYRPRDHTPLGELGREQARLVAERLSGESPFDRLVCSPLVRAHQTGQIVAERLHMQMEVIAALREMTNREIGRVALAEMTDQVMGRYGMVRYVGAWLRKPFMERVREATTQLIREYPEQRVLVISHGGFIWGALAHFFPEQRKQLSRRRQVANCSITRIRVAPGGATLVELNEVGHLGDCITY